ncbi:hypothetical protein EW146_g6025 [Bondarzewia mesenterica]|uniref:Uncharacterized protein n=1 Tax=Bondarzewia mesenterica TaxID=1095465 RepID=A0A4S4LQC8_9AGAM|nr:hypothetical protein EW146_g6025 [Bondarzewia mesenterica]
MSTSTSNTGAPQILHTPVTPPISRRVNLKRSFSHSNASTFTLPVGAHHAHEGEQGEDSVRLSPRRRLASPTTPTSRLPALRIDTTPQTPQSPQSMVPNEPGLSSADTEILSPWRLGEVSPSDKLYRDLLPSKEGVEVRDYAFDPVNNLIRYDWHLRNTQKHNLNISGEAVWRLVRMGWIEFSEVEQFCQPHIVNKVRELAFKAENVRTPETSAIPTAKPSLEDRVRWRWNLHSPEQDDLPDRQFFGDDFIPPPYVESVPPPFKRQDTEKVLSPVEIHNPGRGRPLRRTCAIYRM